MDIEKIIADANATGNPVTRATYDAFVRLGMELPNSPTPITSADWPMYPDPDVRDHNKLEAAIWGPRGTEDIGPLELSDMIKYPDQLDTALGAFHQIRRAFHAQPYTITRVDWDTDETTGEMTLRATGVATMEGIRALAAQFSTPYDHVTLNHQTYAMLSREAHRALARRTTRKHQRGNKARRHQT